MLTRTVFALCALLLLAVTVAQAQSPSVPPDSSSPAADPSGELRVAVRIAPPFVIKQDGAYSGIAIELWEDIAAEQGWTFAYHEAGLAELFDGVSDGRFDVGVGALTVTAAREERVDFSHPFHSGGLGIAVGATPENTVLNVLRRLLSWQFLAWVGGLVLLLGSIGVLAWLTERRANPGQFGGHPLSGIGNGFWWAAVTMATVGYGDKAPVTFGGRLLGLIWMFTAIVLVATFTAGITASLTVGALQGSVQGPDDLPKVRVATVAGSTSADWLAARGTGAQHGEGIAPLLSQAAQGRVDAVVYDAPILQYLVARDHADKLSVLPIQFDRQLYALALAPSRPDRRELINRSLLRALDQDAWRTRLHQYLGPGEL
ncbi:MAG: transporter substrate-binding domain-containing protein [Xanthomonadales bacterium]|nr:transporter substrate-binding domain-containing protein [Xanthomonadales bacterium]